MKTIFGLSLSFVLFSANAFAGGAYCQVYLGQLENGAKVRVATYQIIHSLADDNIEEYTEISGSVKRGCDRFSEVKPGQKRAQVCGLKVENIKLTMDENCG